MSHCVGCDRILAGKDQRIMKTSTSKQYDNVGYNVKYYLLVAMSVPKP